ncbi:MAG TPA: hypothetical protein VFT95_01110, partial [Micromonosporaceae bacterium]|nr:hypothetical protein [Micromonosporaceae bacterium]
MSAAAQSEIARYTEAVRAALADMPAKARDELLEDLPEHLAEVAAEGEGPLEDRLGPPDRYAAELRASAGVAPRRKDSFADTARSAAVQVRGRLRRLDARIGPMIGYGTASEFLRLLRPAWWVLRGYLAAMIVTYATDSSGNGVLPRVEGNEFLGLLMLAVFVVASIWLGRRTGGLGRWPRQIVLAGSGLIVLIAFVWFLDVDRQARNAPWVDGGYVSGTPYDHISDVFVYDQDGNLVTGVYLYDQHGQPIVLGGGECVVVDGP